MNNSRAFTPATAVIGDMRANIDLGNDSAFGNGLHIWTSHATSNGAFAPQLTGRLVLGLVASNGTAVISGSTNAFTYSYIGAFGNKIRLIVSARNQGPPPLTASDCGLELESITTDSNTSNWSANLSPVGTTKFDLGRSNSLKKFRDVHLSGSLYAPVTVRGSSVVVRAGAGVVDQGQNTTGQYICFDDGTLLMYWSLAVALTSGAGEVDSVMILPRVLSTEYARANVFLSWAWEAFNWAERPLIKASIVTGQTTVGWHFYYPYAAAKTVTVRAFCIGRWKE